ncbi:unnamed protein product [Rotaria sp. Silwood2]|nr:unnamed protein product [Rotaria sp. Silwood2]
MMINVFHILDQIIYWNGQNWVRSCAFHGNNLSHVEISAELCGGKCSKTPQCTHYTWTTSNAGTCWMKKGNVSKADASPMNDTSMICGVREDIQQGITDNTVQWNEQYWARSCDFHGNDLSHVEISPALCGGKCSETQECSHYTWTTANGGTCWMKKWNASKTDAFLTNDPTMICGVREDIQQSKKNSTVQWNGQYWARSCAFYGNDLYHVKISAELCGEKCSETPQCTHYTWTTSNGGTCWIKNGNVSKADALPTNDPTMVCGFREDIQQSKRNSTVRWNGRNWAMSCDFHGNDLSHVEISAELCGGKCSETQQCTHYTWTTSNGGTCWMKKANVSKADAFLTNDLAMVCGVVMSIKRRAIKFF